MKIKSDLLAVAAIVGMMSVAAAPVSAAEIIINGGFESGRLSPLVFGRAFVGPGNSAQWKVASSTAFTGTYSSEANNNFEVVQKFSPVAVASITSITFGAITPIMAIELFYSDGVEEKIAVIGNTSGWKTFDITSFLDTDQTNLVGISFWGNTGGIADLDNVSVAATVTTPAVPEASTWVMMLAGFATLGFVGYRGNKAATFAA